MQEFRGLQRFHVMRGGKRTTVTVDSILSEYLAVHLGVAPYTLESHAAIRTWLQGRIDADSDPGRTGISQWLVGEMLDALVSPELRKQHGKCSLERMLR